jgi:hypothetical protein
MVQVEMAFDALSIINAKEIHISYGTGYHTGNEEDFEKILARRLKATIRSQEWIDVNGCVFDVKHHVGSSGIPHGRHTATAKEHLWNQLWAERELQPKSNVILRSHVHYYGHCGGTDWLAMTLPALQGMGSKYGARRCSGLVDFGMVEFDVNTKGEWSWTPHLAKIQGQVRKARKI